MLDSPLIFFMYNTAKIIVVIKNKSPNKIPSPCYVMF